MQYSTISKLSEWMSLVVWLISKENIENKMCFLGEMLNLLNSLESKILIIMKNSVGH